MTTLNDLMTECGANAVIVADAGNGAGSPEAGHAVRYDDDVREAYGEVEMEELDAVHTSADGYECGWASEWMVTGEGDNPYRVRLYF